MPDSQGLLNYFADLFSFLFEGGEEGGGFKSGCLFFYSLLIIIYLVFVFFWTSTFGKWVKWFQEIDEILNFELLSFNIEHFTREKLLFSSVPIKPGISSDATCRLSFVCSNFLENNEDFEDNNNGDKRISPAS